MAKKERFVSVERTKLDALVSENIRLRKDVNKIWHKAPHWLIVITAVSAFFGALIGTLPV